MVQFFKRCHVDSFPEQDGGRLFNNVRGAIPLVGSASLCVFLEAGQVPAGTGQADEGSGCQIPRLGTMEHILKVASE